MAIDHFLKLDGVKGEAQDSEHKDEIDVLSWSWGMSQSGTGGMGGGSGAGKVSVQDISLTKYLDVSSPTLHLFCANGKHVAKAVLVARKAGENPLEYLKIELEDVLVSSVSTGGSGGEDRLTENITLNFKKVKTTYTQQNKDGSKGAAPEMQWNIATNKSE